MNSDQLVTLCQRHHALLLTSDADMISIAVVGNPAAEMMEALRFDQPGVAAQVLMGKGTDTDARLRLICTTSKSIRWITSASRWQI